MRLESYLEAENERHCIPAGAFLLHLAGKEKILKDGRQSAKG